MTRENAQNVPCVSLPTALSHRRHWCRRRRRSLLLLLLLHVLLLCLIHTIRLLQGFLILNCITVLRILLILFPLRRLRPLRIPPWPVITQHTPAGTLALPTKNLGQILTRHLRQQLLLIRATQHIYLV